MKKAPVAVLITFLAMSVAVFSQESDDYIKGYIAGYEDSKAGNSPRFEESSTSDSGYIANSAMEIRYYVDEVGDPTDNGYISNKGVSTGTFSNSATTNSGMRWYIIVSENEISFVIFEYGRLRLTGSSGYPDNYRVYIKDANGEMHTFSGENSSDRIAITSNRRDVLNILLQNKPVKISINEVSEYSTSSYNLGTLDCTGFSELYSKL